MIEDYLCGSAKFHKFGVHNSRIKWARDQRAEYERLLATAENGKFKISEVDGSGHGNDNTLEHIARIKSAIASLNELIGD